MSARLLLSVLVAALCSESNAYLTYKAKIPNGDKVPNPCNRSTIWPGVGHENSGGSGTRNPFGLDFRKNNYVWDRTLCQKDSDGDGLTNGQELGDPNCTWTEGRKPAVSTDISHPGICEPLLSDRCSEKNSWMANCSLGYLNCPAIKEPGVRNFTMRFPMTPVPTKETTYICYQFALPNDSVSDIIAIEPVNDNLQVLHHVILYGCTSEPKGRPTNEPFECGLIGEPPCMAFLAVFAVGTVGQCLTNQLGFRMGPKGFTHALVQLHWNNPEHDEHFMDSSGLRIYHTTQLRPYPGQIAMMGQTYLEIPPGLKEVTSKGSCASVCSKKLPHSIYLTSILFHMHPLGKSGDIHLIRNGSRTKILDVAEYDFEAQNYIDLQKPFEVKPGDEIQVNCVYESTKMNSTTYYGEGTSAEMCFGFVEYYPLVEGVGLCGQWKSINICNDYGDVEFEACEISTFMKLISLLPKLCAGNCTCASIMSLVSSNKCYNYPDVKQYIDAFLPDSAEVLEKCRSEKPLKSGSHSPGHGASLGFGLVLTLMAYASHQ